MSLDAIKPVKPLGHRAYGSIPHLPGSRRGPGDHGISEQQAKICTSKARDRHDLIIVQEKLDGSCVSVAKIEGRIVPLIRAGYPAETSNYEQHHAFHRWAMKRADRFSSILKDGERAVGEWLMVAHGTRYNLMHAPFVMFDIMEGHKRLTHSALLARNLGAFHLPKTIHIGMPASVELVLSQLEPSGHGALDPVEGAVWRVERRDEVDFLAKYVRPDKEDGKYFPEKTGQPEIFNWYEQ